MELIDWPAVARGALWVTGLSLVLATCSYASWQSARHRVALRWLLDRAACRAVIALGLLLFSVGLAWGAVHLGERAAWGLLVLLFAGWVITDWRAARSQDADRREAS